MAKKYIIGNWKMNPLALNDAEKIFKKIKKSAARFKNVKTIICPPFVFIGELIFTYSGNKISFGAQDSFFETKGSFTGEISPYQLADMGVEYVILGHSERRVQGETSKVVNKKIKVALLAGLNVILCIGEKERDNRGEYLRFLEEEIKSSLLGISREKLGKIIIAYEPIWAIGGDEDEAMTPRDLHQMKLFILKILKEIYGTKGLETLVIYGGSSEPGNAKDLIKDGEVDGLLVGHESLIPEDFLEIIRIADSIK